MLKDPIIAKIDQITGKISVYAPVGTGTASVIMIPRYTAAGQVYIEGAAQISGVTGRVYNTPVTYTVISANGKNSRTYIVTVKELQSTIYVNRNAHGTNDGTSWNDAFISLIAACEAAAQFPEDDPKDIWSAAGTYAPGIKESDYLKLVPNTSFTGGFAGNETAKSQRNAAANKVIVSGNLGGARSYNLFGNFNADNTLKTINGDISFEDIEFTSAMANGSGSRNRGAAINAALSNTAALNISGCKFTDLGTSSDEGGAAVYFSGSISAEISNTTIDMITNGGAIYSPDRIKITDSSIKNAAGTYGVYSDAGLEIKNLELRTFTGDYGIYSGIGLEITGLELHDVTGIGISVGSGSMNVSGINASNISGNSLVYDVSAGSIYIKSSNFNNCGYVNISDSSFIQITDTKISNVRSGATNGLYAITTGNLSIEKTTVDGVPGGRGIYASSPASIGIYDSKVSNCTGTGSGGGIYLTGTGRAVISNTVIDSVRGSSGAGIYAPSSITDFQIQNNTVISNVQASSGTGGAVYRAGYLKITNSNIRDITGGTYAVYSTSGLDIDGLGLSNITGIGVTASAGNMNLSGITASNISGNSVNYTSGGTVILSSSSFTNCGSVYISGSSSRQIISTTITTVRSGVDSGLNVSSSDGGNITIQNVSINGVPNGRGIRAQTYGTTTISSSQVMNCTANDAGGGIYLIGYRSDGTYGSASITNTTIGNVVASNGGGIYAQLYNLSLSGITVRNARANNNGGGLYFSGTGNLSITSAGSRSLFDNCRSDEGSYMAGGAVFYSGSVGNYSISNTDFTNCTARGDAKMLYLNTTGGTVQGCTFSHNSSVFSYAAPTDVYMKYMIFAYGDSTFNSCTFTNLTTNNASVSGNTRSETYIFGSIYDAQSSPGIVYTNVRLRITNCNFTFAPNVKMGLVAAYCGNVADDEVDTRPANNSFYMSGTTIIDQIANTNQNALFSPDRRIQPVFWSRSRNTDSGSNQFGKNNTYKGRAITGGIPETSSSGPGWVDQGIIRILGMVRFVD
jgi:hypothetical protein